MKELVIISANFNKVHQGFKVCRLIGKSLRYRESISAALKYDSSLAWNNFYHRHRRLNIQGNPFDSSAHVNIQRFRSFVRPPPPLHPPPLISCRTFPPIRICDSQRIRGFVIRDDNKPRDITARVSPFFFCASNSGVLSYLMHLPWLDLNIYWGFKSFIADVLDFSHF